MKEKLSEYQAHTLINDAQNRILVQKQEVAKLEPQVKEYKEAYERLSKELIAAKEKIEDDTEILEWASRIKNGVKSSEFRVIRSESHNDMKQREKNKLAKGKREFKYKWTQWAVDTLKSFDTLVEKDYLFEVVAEINMIDRKLWSKLKWGCIHNCWSKNAENTKLGRLSGVLFEYKGYFGLREWMTEDNKPAGKYASQFQSKAV